MKIQVIDLSTHKPLTSSKIQLQIKGKDSGVLTLSTDPSGFFQLDEKYKGQQIALSFDGKVGTPISATDGAKLTAETKTKEKLK